MNLLSEKSIETRQHNTYFADSFSCVSEHIAEGIVHGPSSLSASPWVLYTADHPKYFTLTTILPKAKDKPRLRRKHHDSDSGLSAVGVKSGDDRFDKVKASSKVSSAVVLNTS